LPINDSNSQVCNLLEKKLDVMKLQTQIRDSRLYLSGWFRHRILRRYLALDHKPCDTLLDVGGGTGNISYHFKNDFKALILVDISAQSLKNLEKSLFHPLGADGLALPLKNGSVDRILSVDFQEHLQPDQIPNLLRELHRVLKPGGILAVFTSCYGFSLRRLLFRLQGLPSKERLDWSDWARDDHLNRPTPAEHVSNAIVSGFEIKNHCYYGHFFDPLARRFHQLLMRLYLATGNRHQGADLENLAAGYRSSQPSAWVELYFRMLILFAYLDKVLLGKIPGSAIFLMLHKPDA
jgi:SAM-dependent methyltransferase